MVFLTWFKGLKHTPRSISKHTTLAGLEPDPTRLQRTFLWIKTVIFPQKTSIQIQRKQMTETLTFWCKWCCNSMGTLPAVNAVSGGAVARGAVAVRIFGGFFQWLVLLPWLCAYECWCSGEWYCCAVDVKVFCN